MSAALTSDLWRKEHVRGVCVDLRGWVWTDKDLRSARKNGGRTKDGEIFHHALEQPS